MVLIALKGNSIAIASTNPRARITRTIYVAEAFGHVEKGRDRSTCPTKVGRAKRPQIIAEKFQLRTVRIETIRSQGGLIILITIRRAYREMRQRSNSMTK